MRDINKSVGHVKGGSVLSGDTAEEQPSGLCSEDAAGQWRPPAFWSLDESLGSESEGLT